MTTILVDVLRIPSAAWAGMAVCLLGLAVLIARYRGQLRSTRAALAQARQQLARQAERLELALDGADEALWDWDIAANKTYYGERWSRMLGYSPHEIGDSVDVWERLVHPGDVDAAMKKLGAHMEGESDRYEAEFRMQCKDGGWRWIRARGRVVGRAADGTPTRVAGTHVDITHSKEAAEALLREQNLLRTLMDNLPDVIYIKDLESRFLLINQALADVLHVSTPAEALGKTDFDFFPEPMAARFRADELRVLNGEPFVGQEEQALDAQGNPLWLLTTKTAIRDAQGKVVGLVGLGRDIADMHRAREAVEASARLKSEFLANMSHEIRTPMNGVMGMIQLALDTDLTNEQRSFLETAYRSALSLLHLLNDILDFSKIEAGKLTLEAVEFRLEDIMLDVLRSSAVIARQKGLELNYSSAPDVPASLRGDPHRLKQVVTNLVSNAIKFTHKGEVTISVGLLESGPDGLLLEIAVKDTGIGIPQEAQAGIFEVFTQADGSTTRNYGGTGLGLSICSRLVSLMNGDIGVTSVPGQGSTFRFTARFAAAESREPPASPHLAILRGLRVLVLDDNETNRRIVGSFTEALGMRTELSENAAAALQQVKDAAASQDPFNVLLLDVHMPQRDGFDLVRDIRSFIWPDELVILMLSSVEVSNCLVRCRELGIHRYLTKPICKSDLQRELLSAVSSRPEADSPPDPFQERSLSHLARRQPAVPGLSPQLRVLVAEDNVVNQRLESKVISKLGHRVTLVGDGAEALNAVRKSRFDLVLMDVQMPRMDGLQATRSIRRYEAEAGLPAVPIIALTALAMSGDREKCLDAGMDDCLCKPFDIADLRRILELYTTQVAGVAAEYR